MTTSIKRNRLSERGSSHGSKNPIALERSTEPTVPVCWSTLPMATCRSRMYRNTQAGGRGGPVQYAQAGYEASFGTYQINDAHTFTFHVEGAMVRSLIGKDLPRSYEFAGNQLIVKSTDAKEHWKVAWEHF